jgi:hypothetical protein
MLPGRESPSCCISTSEFTRKTLVELADDSSRDPVAKPAERTAIRLSLVQGARTSSAMNGLKLKSPIRTGWSIWSRFR